MERNYIVFVPTPGVNDGGNLFLRNMLNLLSKKYNVVGVEQISNDFKKIKKVKAVILNWSENTLDSHIKSRLLLYKILGVKVCWFFHNRVPHDYKSKKQIKNIKWLADISNHIFILSEASRKYLPNERKNTRKCIYLPHINYIGGYPENQRNIRTENGIADTDFVFSFIGLIRPYKNIEILMQAFQELGMDNIKLIIAGKVNDNQYMKKLQEICREEDNIILKPGHVSNGEMEAYLRASDVLVLPYNKASSMNSGAMIMAFSYGRTVIVPQIAMAEDIRAEKLAFVYDYENVQENLTALKEQMLQAYQCGREEVHKLGGKAREFVERNNSVEKVLEALRRIDI